jgi:hypothetical protein
MSQVLLLNMCDYNLFQAIQIVHMSKNLYDVKILNVLKYLTILFLCCFIYLQMKNSNNLFYPFNFFVIFVYFILKLYFNCFNVFYQILYFSEISILIYLLRIWC